MVIGAVFAQTNNPAADRPPEATDFTDFFRELSYRPLTDGVRGVT